MALTNKLTAIANAVRSKTGTTGKMTLDGMATAISNLKTTFATQTKSATPTESAQDIVPDANYDGLSKVTVSAVSKTFVGSGVTRQSAKTVTPSKSTQTAVASGVYTTGAVSVGAIPSEYIIPSGSETKTKNGTYDVTNLAQLIVNVAGGGGGLPEGIEAVDFGEINIASAFTTTRQTFNHNLGVTPDFVMVYATSNIATTYSMLFAFRHVNMGYRSSAYNSYYGYHGNSTTTVTMANSNSTSYGVSNMTASTFQLASHSTSYYWRAGTYKYIAVKFT